MTKQFCHKLCHQFCEYDHAWQFFHTVIYIALGSEVQLPTGPYTVAVGTVSNATSFVIYCTTLLVQAKPGMRSRGWCMAAHMGICSTGHGIVSSEHYRGSDVLTWQSLLAVGSSTIYDQGFFLQHYGPWRLFCAKCVNFSTQWRSLFTDDILWVVSA